MSTKPSSKPDTGPNTAPDESSGVLLRWIWSAYLRRHALLVVIAMLLMAVEGGMLGALSYMMQPMFDKVFVEGDQAALWWVGFGILGIFIVRAMANVGQRVMLSVVEQRTAAGLRRDLLDHLMTLDGSFHQTHPPGFLVQRVQGDVDAVKALWTAIITGAGRDMISLVILLGVAISVDPLWTLVACVGIPMMLVPASIAQRFVRRRAREARDLGAGLATRLDEVFHGIVPVKLNRLERYQSGHYGQLTDKLVRAEVRARMGSAAIPGLVDIMAGLGFLGVVIFGGREIMAGEKTIGEFMSFFTAIGFAFEPLRRLGNISGVWQTAAAALERLKGLLETQPTIFSPAEPKQAPSGTPQVQLQDVKLSYGDTAVLRGATLVAEAGQTTALVGPSGAGKSTIFNLLTRLVDPAAGAVTLNGIDVRDLALPDLRALFSVVSQDAALFDETLRENILLGRTDVSDAQLKKVLDAAHVSDFLPQLSKGLDTPVGPRGSALSGGQRQRVAIARALLRDTPILLLDEATSALDAESEKTVQEALDRLATGRTTLVIAHRLSTVRGADKIIVMDKGRVVDEGTHDDLLARGGIYTRLHDLQFRSDGPTAEARAARTVPNKPTARGEKRGLWARIFSR